MRGATWIPLVATLGLALALVGCLDDGSGPRAIDENVTSTDPIEDNRSGDAVLSAPDVALTEIASGLEQPVFVTSPGDGSGRLFVVEQPGRVRVLEDGTPPAEGYLDVTDRTFSENERGLLGLAFSPRFADDGRLYLSYTGNDGTSHLEAFAVDEPATGTPSANGTVLFTLEQPAPIHNGGHITFGPDGYLYYGLGDGGPGGDPDEQAQNTSTPFGSLLRLNVTGDTIQAPPDNPFVGTDEGHELVWAYGLRNPWRFSFDRGTGDLYIGDVGQADWEEVNHQPAGSSGGENYGWDHWEGGTQFEGNRSREGLEFPILVHGHEGRSAIVGGYVYRGEAITELEGAYVYGNLNGTILVAGNTTEGWRSQVMLETNLTITSFGEDADGELYVADRGGGVFRLAPR